MSAPVVTEEIRAEVSRLRTQGYGHKRIARALGVSATTALRLQNPAFAARQRQLSREAKRRRHGTCGRCGAATPYHGKRGKTVSDLCDRCNRRELAARQRSRRGTGPVQTRALAFLFEPRSRRDLAAALGIPGYYAGPLVDRLLRYGLIVRVSRGVYVAAERHEEAA